MAKRSKRYRAAAAKIERTRRYSLEEAVRTIAAGDGPAKFDETVGEAKAGKVEFRVEKAGIVHVPIGKRSFGTERLLENAHALLTSLLRAKPAAAKGNYLQSVALSTTMGPAVRIDPVAVRATA